MKKIANTYIGGLDKDTSYNKANKQSLYHNDNFRILTQGESTNGSLSFVKGNATIRCLNAYVHDGYKIIGNCLIRENIVLFWAEETAINADSDTTACFIDMLYYNGDDTYKKIELWTGQGLNFRLDKPIESLGRYETEAIIKVYWTDNNNQLKFANIAPDLNDSGEILDPAFQSSYTNINNYMLEDFSSVPRIGSGLHSVFKYVSYSTGGNLLSGKNAYTYKLYNKDGNSTNYAPISELIPIGRDPLTTSDRLLYGEDKSIYCNVSVNLRLEDYNDTYDYIEVVRVYYADVNAEPIVTVIKREALKNTYTTSDSGTTDIEELTIADIVIDKNPLITKTIATKDDRLFIANVKEDTFDIDYDARAYRFNSSRIANLYSENGDLEAGLDGANPVYPIDETLDLISPYNDNHIANNNPSAQDSYIYDKSGSVLGGDGSNVSYGFGVATHALDKWASTAFKYEGNYAQSDMTLTDDLNYKYGLHRGFLRGEIYRFGVVFINSYGQESFVKWIGDIRMPEIYDYSIDIRSVTANDQAYAQNVYPIFTLNNIPEESPGVPYTVKIVYVKRDYTDKGVLCKGVVSATLKHNAELYGLFPGTAVNGNGGNTFIEDVVTILSPEIDIENYPVYSGLGLSIEGYYDLTSSQLMAGDQINSFKSITVLDNINGARKLTTMINEVAKLIGTSDRTATPNVGIERDSDSTLYTCKGWSSSEYLSFQADELSQRAATVNFIELDTSLPIVIAKPQYGSITIDDNSFQYGGFSYNARLNNTYIPASDPSEVTAGTVTVSAVYGDTFIRMYDRLGGSTQNNTAGEAPTKGRMFNMMFPVETGIDLRLLHSTSYNKIYTDPLSFNLQEKDNQVVIDQSGAISTKDWTDLNLYNNGYSAVNYADVSLPKPFNYSKTETLDTIIKYSNNKFNGETIDSWLQFKPNNYKQADTRHGSVNKLVGFKDQIFSFQESGLSLLSINPRVTQIGEDGINTVLGTGEVLDRLQYLSTNVGVQRNNDVIASINGLYWIDVNYKAIYRYAGQLEKLSSTKNMTKLALNSLDEFSNMTGVYDSHNEEIIFTVNNENEGATYNNRLFLCTFVSPNIYRFFGENLNRLELRVGLSYRTEPLIVSNPTEFVVLEKTEDYIEVELIDGTLTGGNTYDLSFYLTEYNNFNLVFNEKLNVFQGYYTFRADLYVPAHDGFFSSDGKFHLYKHNEGKYGEFHLDNSPLVEYGVYDIILPLDGYTLNEANNLDFYAEAFQNGNYLQNLTLSAVKAFNNFQESDFIKLYPMDLDKYIIDTSGYKLEGVPNFASLCNIRKNVEHWRLQVPRFRSEEDSNVLPGYTTGSPTSDRFRSNYIRLRFYYIPDRYYTPSNDDTSFKVEDMVTTVQEMLI